MPAPGQSLLPTARPQGRLTAEHRALLADGPLCIPFTMKFEGRQADAKLRATVVSAPTLGQGNPRFTSRPITVQDLVDVHVEVEGQRVPIADDALYTLMKKRGVELDWPYSSRTEVAGSRFLGLLGVRPLVTVDTHGFRLMVGGEDKRFHSGLVAIHHPERVY